MEYTNLIFGTFALAFGFYTLYLRLSGKILSSEKLVKMKELMGNSIGNIVHIIAYTIVPLTAGVALLSAAFMAK